MKLHFLRNSAVALAAVVLAASAPGWAQTAPDAALVAKGKAIFEAGVDGIPCAACHGEDPTGVVGGAIAGQDAATVHAALADNAVMQSLALTEDQIAAVSAYLVSIGTATVVSIAPAAGGTPASVSPTYIQLATLGKEIFESGANGLGCKECHGHDATVLVAPNLAGRKAGDVHMAIMSVDGMAGITLTADQLAAVVAYLTQAAQ
ncbi:MAG: cytochrome c [Rhodobacteraceae bacterium]|nr:cytochrome c [Paracoccaceae bacterium]